MILTAGLVPPGLVNRKAKEPKPVVNERVIKVRARKRPIMFDVPLREHMVPTEEQKETIPATVINLHKKLMSSCYGYKDSVYYQKTDNGMFVVKHWWDVSEFYKDIQKLKNYEAYVLRPQGYSCTIRIYDSNYIGPDTICIIPCGRMTVYAANRAMKIKINDVTHVCIIIDDIVRLTNIPRAVIARARMKVGEFESFEVRGFTITQHSGLYRYADSDIKTVSES